jgi:hypothetical protein
MVTYGSDSYFFPAGVGQPQHPCYEEALEAHKSQDIETLERLDEKAWDEQTESWKRNEEWVSKMAKERPRRRPKG